MAVKKTAKATKKTVKLSRVAEKPSKVSLLQHEEEMPQQTGYTFRVNRKTTTIVMLFGAILLVIALLYTNKGLFVAATVNGQPIPRLTLVRELENQAGKQTLNSLVTKTLIEQEAKKKGVTMTEKEINDELKQQEDFYAKQGQKLDQLLQAQGWNREFYKERIRVQKFIEKLLAGDVKVTQKEVDEYIEKNKELFPQGTDQKEIRATVEKQLRDQKMNDKYQTWIADLQKKAKINYFVSF